MFNPSTLTLHGFPTIGILDSGVGGLSVYLPLRSALPDADILYLADAAFAPYGTKAQSALLDRLRIITRWFIDQGVELLVIACNTATVNGIDALRTEFPKLEIVGMEPAIKPASRATDRIVVLGTESTVTNPRYRELVDRYAVGKTVWNVGANELVTQVESGRLTDPTVLEQKLQVGVREPQSVVIGCSHFSFLKATIEKRWPDLQIFDGADGVVSQVVRIAGSTLRVEPRDGHSEFLTTGPERDVQFLAPPIHFRHVDIFGDTPRVNIRSLRE